MCCSEVRMSSHWWAASTGFSVACLLRFSLHQALRALQRVHLRIKDTEEEKEEPELGSVQLPLHCASADVWEVTRP